LRRCTQPAKPNYLHVELTKKRRKTDNKKRNGSLITLISLKGIERLFSSLESRPRMRAAWRKLRLVAAGAFVVALASLCQIKQTKE
jgi:hypothetical protein